MIVAVPRETAANEPRVALTPLAVAALTKAKFDVHVESGAGLPAGFTDADYLARGAQVVADRAALLGGAQLILRVRTPDVAHDAADLALLKSGQVLIGLADPLTSRAAVEALAERGVSLFALELVPRITRAQSMDVLSSQANLAGYKAVLLAAGALGKIFPMLMTAAGTIQPARVLVVGAGVAGLQAIATAKRLGAVVSAYDVRPAVKEQVQSLGARFVELPLEGSEGTGGYAREQSAEQVRRQQELMAKVVADSDVVITTAAIPGKKSPVLVTAEMVAGMAPGSVIVDLAAERGGNCALTVAGQTVVQHGVTIMGPLNLPGTLAKDASGMYANNLVKFLTHLAKDGALRWDVSDEITTGSLVLRDGRLVNAQVATAWGVALPPANGDAPVQAN